MVQVCWRLKLRWLDWNHGGYIKSRIVDCYYCDGTGLNEVEPEEEEEE
jgi:hypothetical protein